LCYFKKKTGRYSKHTYCESRNITSNVKCHVSVTSITVRIHWRDWDMYCLKTYWLPDIITGATSLLRFQPKRNKTVTQKFNKHRSFKLIDGVLWQFVPNIRRDNRYRLITLLWKHTKNKKVIWQLAKRVITSWLNIRTWNIQNKKSTVTPYDVDPIRLNLTPYYLYIVPIEQKNTIIFHPLNKERSEPPELNYVENNRIPTSGTQIMEQKIKKKKKK